MAKSRLLKAVLVGAAVVAPVSAVVAQAGWVPGSEIAGQTLQIQTQGVMNSVYLAPDRTATISTARGTAVRGNWSATNNQLCMSAAGIQECWPYTEPFQPGQQVGLMSNCGQVSTFFLMRSTN